MGGGPLVYNPALWHEVCGPRRTQKTSESQTELRLSQGRLPHTWYTDPREEEEERERRFLSS